MLKRFVYLDGHYLLSLDGTTYFSSSKIHCSSCLRRPSQRQRRLFPSTAYARIAALKLPIGSGAIESAIRRVVNLRLKGPSIYWHKTTAEAVLLLRSYYKAGRWNHLERQALTTTTGIAA